MAKKKRAPRKQLLEAGQIAKNLLTERGFQLPGDKSAVDRILHTENAPMLPGIPAYLPYAWTIHAARRVLYDLAREWELKNKNDRRMLTDITEFCKFVVLALKQEERNLNELIHVTVQMKRFDAKLLYRKDAIKGVRKMLIDSFAVAVIAKTFADLPEYIDWFSGWTERLLKEWGEKQSTIK